MQDESDGYKRPQEIDPFCDMTTTFPRHVKEMSRVESRTPAFTVGMNVLRDDMVKQRGRFGRHFDDQITTASG